MAGQVWATNEKGGYMYSGQLSSILRNSLQPQTRFTQHCDARDFIDKGLNQGGAFEWNVYSNVGTQGGRLSENQPMPETSFSIEQNTGAVYEFGNSVPYSGYLDNLSLHPVKDIINQVMKDDAVKVFEAEANAQFVASPLTVTPASGNSATAITLETSGTPTATNNIAMNNTHVKLIADELKERDVPTYSDGNYRAIARPKTFRGFKNDLEGISQYTDSGYVEILNGEIGKSYDGIRFFEQTGIANQGWSNGLSDDAFFFGADTVIEAIVCPPEIRGKLPSDFGRSKGVAWYAIEGFQLAHDTAAQARIIRWDSNA